MNTTKFSKLSFIAILSFLFLATSSVSAQSLKIVPSSFSMTIFGTTNLHNFTEKATQVSGEITMASPKQVKSMSITIPVKSLKSGEASLMDSKTYDAFNANKNPNITFNLLDVTSLKFDGSNINVNLDGNLTMHGVTQKITLQATGKTIKPGEYEFSGTTVVDMTQYKITPPTAMMGMLKVGNKVTLKYKVTFEGAQLAQL